MNTRSEPCENLNIQPKIDIDVNTGSRRLGKSGGVLAVESESIRFFTNRWLMRA